MYSVLRSGQFERKSFKKQCVKSDYSVYCNCAFGFAFPCRQYVSREYGRTRIFGGARTRNVERCARKSRCHYTASTVLYVFDGIEDTTMRAVVQGQVGAFTNVQPVNVSGYVLQLFEQQPIAVDGTTTITVHYVGEVLVVTEEGTPLAKAPRAQDLVQDVLYSPETDGKIIVTIITQNPILCPGDEWEKVEGNNNDKMWVKSYEDNVSETIIVSTPNGKKTGIAVIKIDSFIPDTTPPNISIVRIVGENSATRVREGQKVFLTFTANEALDEATIDVKFGGYAATSITNVEDTTYCATFKIPSGYPEGEVAFTVDYADRVGNAGTQIIKTTDKSVVIVDTTLPVLSPVQISSESGTNYAKEGQKVTLTFTASEELDDTTLKVKFGNVTVTDITNVGDTYSASLVIPSGYSEGEVAFTVDYADLAGNTGAQIIKTTDKSAVIVDTTLPVVTITYTPSTATSGKVVATLTADEPVQDLTDWTRVDDKTFTKEFKANISGTVAVVDLAGNATTANYVISWVKPPSTGGGTTTPPAVTTTTPSTSTGNRTASAISEEETEEETPEEEEVEEEFVPVAAPAGTNGTGDDLLVVSNLAVLLLAALFAIGMAVSYARNNTTAYKNNKYKLLGVPIFIALAVLFFFTQSIYGAFVLYDEWTILFVAGVLAQVMFMAMGARRKVQYAYKAEAQPTLQAQEE